jgi:tetratricopeptide (TPR) repeat protein
MATGQRTFKGNTGVVLRDAILNQLPTPVRLLNPNLSPGLEAVISKALEKGRESRYQSAANVRTDLQKVKNDTESSRTAVAAAEAGLKPDPPSTLSRWVVVTGVAILVVGLTVGSWLFHGRKEHALTEKDTIVLADFTNTTGDAVFDDTLKQGLVVQLEQSPFLSLVSDRRVNEMLKLMGRLPDDRLTQDVTREVCQRVGSKAMLTGSIAALGSQFVIGLKATNCYTGDVLAAAQEQAAGKESVLEALDAAAVHLRGKLGESLSSVGKYATPLVEASTPSLEALKAYSLGEKTRFAKTDSAALPFYERAVELDPNFALAHRAMSLVYINRSEVGRSAESARKAYELREKISERERLTIDAYYYMHVTGQLEKAAEVYEQWQQTYPRDFLPYGNLGVISGYLLGDWEKGLEETREAMLLEPNIVNNYVNLGGIYGRLNRLDQAAEVYKQAEEHNFEGEYLVLYRYHVAFLRDDMALMARAASAAVGKRGTEDILLASQADTEAWHGNLKNANELTRRAMDSAQRNDAKEAAALYQTVEALREVESGNREQARADADAAVKLAPNRDVWVIAALVLARAGDPSAEKLATELDKTFPLDTLVQQYWLPTIRAAVALQRKEHGRAIELLKVAKPIELSQPTNLTISLCPVYLRGEAYLKLRDGNAAEAEFQKFIDHRGLVVNFLWGALARLGLARAYALQGDTAKAHTAYRDFLTLWKSADPDIPILTQAKSEYAKLQ